jgi:hypothetical protein
LKDENKQVHTISYKKGTHDVTVPKREKIVYKSSSCKTIEVNQQKMFKFSGLKWSAMLGTAVENQTLVWTKAEEMYEYILKIPMKWRSGRKTSCKQSGTNTNLCYWVEFTNK